MSVSAEEVKKLRQKTGAGIMDCKEALKQSGNNFDKACDWIKKKGLAKAAKKSSREASEGSISSYIHAGGKLGVLVEVNTETDFVARNETFKSFTRSLSMHIAAMAPRFLSEEDIPEETKNKEKEIFKAQAKDKAKDPKFSDKIAEGLFKKWIDEVCLMNQVFLKEGSEGKETVKQALTSLISQIGENIVIRRFARFELGENKPTSKDN